MYGDRELLIQLGRNIKAERIRKGLTQEDFAEKLGITREYLGRIERGIQNISILKILNISNKLDIEISEILKF